jgi:hypothetical protein
MLFAAFSIAERAVRTAATAANWPSIIASKASPGSQQSMSEYRGLGRSVFMRIPYNTPTTPLIETRSRTLVPGQNR